MYSQWMQRAGQMEALANHMIHTLTDYKRTKTMLLTDSNGKLMAKARGWLGGSQWTLRIYGASWADTATNTVKHANYKRQNLPEMSFPYLKTVKTKREARSELTKLMNSLNQGNL